MGSNSQNISRVISTVMTAWYVRPLSNSYEDGDGLSYGDAWAGFSNVVWGNHGVQAGDTLYVCGKHYDSLRIGARGKSGQRITIRGDCAEEAGEIHGGTEIPIGAWEDANSGVFQYRLKSKIYGLSEDNVPLKFGSDAKLLDGSWYYDAKNSDLYYRPTSGAPHKHSVHRISRPAAIDYQNNNHVDVRYLSITPSRFGLFEKDKNSPGWGYTNVSNMSFSYCLEGINFHARNNSPNTNIAIHNNEFFNCGKGIFVGATNGAELSTKVTIHNNRLINTGLTGNADERWDEVSSPLNAIDLEAIGVQNLNNSIIYENTIIGGAHEGGIVGWVNPASAMKDNSVHNNLIKNVRYRGVTWGSGNTPNLHQHNVVHSNIIVNAKDSGIRLNGTESTKSNYCYKNVIYNAKNSIDIPGKGDNAWEISDNFSLYPSIYHFRRDGRVMGVVSDYNCFFPATGELFYFNGSARGLSYWRKEVGADRNTNTSYGCYEAIESILELKAPLVSPESSYYIFVGVFGCVGIITALKNVLLRNRATPEK